jgi:hypothetical protein
VSRDPSKTLTILFAIEPGTIDHDIREMKADLVGLKNEISSLLAIPFPAKTPETDARLSHFLMVQACVLSSTERLPPDIKTFYASFGAGGIVQDAERAAADKDTLALLSAEMENNQTPRRTFHR